MSQQSLSQPGRDRGAQSGPLFGALCSARLNLIKFGEP